MNKLTTFAVWVGGALLAGILLLSFPEYFIAVFVVGVSAALYVYDPRGEIQTGGHVENEQTDEYAESEACPFCIDSYFYRNVIVPTEVEKMIDAENAAKEHIT
jgi:hypothetical protein